ncbi:hypothetical protein ACFVWF_24195 [Rhodococcus qingshengii]|jgi:hypothetical protein|uniref:hypothetical protein n=1 Tax=Rhodococcus qingshengii TaxID=334542 RepID=UPI0013897A5B|nr:hypothetical protein [Rhodococcus qingshengii]
MSGQVLEALLQWRTGAIAEDQLQIGVIKDAHLTQIARSNRRTTSEIESMLPRTAKPMAGHIANVIAGVQESGSDRDAANPAQVSQPAEAVSAPASPIIGNTLDLTSDDFCEFDYSTDGTSDAKLQAKRSRGGYRIAWEPFQVAGDQVVVYRVVSSEEHAAYKPEVGELLGSTTETSLTDLRPPSSAVRFVQVWCHVGRTVADAASEQPTLLGTAQIISPVVDLAISEDEGTIIGRWDTWPGVTVVRVMRTSLSGALGSAGQVRLHPDDDNLGGFVDSTAERGQRYLYRAICEVPVGSGTELSPPVEEVVQVSVILSPVLDLSVDTYGDADEPRFDLQWSSPPVGKVVIYRTETGPKPGVEESVLAEGALEASGGLPSDARLIHPIKGAQTGNCVMAEVSWPRGWTRAYFTPVTTLDNAVQVGKTVTATRPLGAVRHLRLVERCAEQLLTFAWPEGAAAIEVHVSSRGMDSASALAQPAGHEISRSRYERDGGLHFPSQLPANGCSVHVVPVSYTAGNKVLGAPSVVDYPGLLRVQYDIIARSAGLVLDIALAPERDTHGSPPFILVYNANRLPLSSMDGTAVDVWAAGTDGGGRAKQFQPVQLNRADRGVTWSADVRGLYGYVRLFADLLPTHRSTFALIDPAVEKLWVDGREIAGGQTG